MPEKQTRPNRIIKIPRELYDIIQNIAYWNNMNPQDFIIELLSLLSYEHGKMIEIEACKAKQIFEKMINDTNVLNDKSNNNKFSEINI